jgi:hypothetical protein
MAHCVQVEADFSYALSVVHITICVGRSSWGTNMWRCTIYRMGHPKYLLPISAFVAYPPQYVGGKALLLIFVFGFRLQKVTIIVFLFPLRELVCTISNTTKVSDKTFRGMPCMLRFDVNLWNKGLTLEKFLLCDWRVCNYLFICTSKNFVACGTEAVLMMFISTL